MLKKLKYELPEMKLIIQKCQNVKIETDQIKIEFMFFQSVRSWIITVGSNLECFEIL